MIVQLLLSFSFVDLFALLLGPKSSGFILLQFSQPLPALLPPLCPCSHTPKELIVHSNVEFVKFCMFTKSRPTLQCRVRRILHVYQSCVFIKSVESCCRSAFLVSHTHRTTLVDRTSVSGLALLRSCARLPVLRHGPLLHCSDPFAPI